MTKSKFLSPVLVRKYSKIDRTKVAQQANVSPKWVREVLGGRELITGPAADTIIEIAERMSTETDKKRK